MGLNTVASRVVRIDTGSRYVISYPEYPDNCDNICVLCEDSGRSLTVTAGEFEMNALAALRSLRKFMGGVAGDATVLDIEGIPGYRMSIGVDDVFFMTNEDGDWVEVVYWNKDELTEDPEMVLGAICGALNSFDEDRAAITG